ncbi:hypothetical protein ABG067_005026 [Albugo candida]
MEDDLWRQDGSFRGMGGKEGDDQSYKKGSKSRDSSLKFNRVIPKFLQEFQAPPAIMAKFAVATTEEEDDELDEVQKAAIEEFVRADTEKRDSTQSECTRKRKKPSSNKKCLTRPQANIPKLDNKRLLSFPVDEE